uniref:RNA ligase with polynucleotide kinase domain n=1 Tax=Marseillevirus LCMAC101 TaxID=2506602 RepID=A0A481YSH4_9VIRU|nr:MAG: RNA ligase with polynucleotide kinase domain [Marseillevirus LCMAC101]
MDGRRSRWSGPMFGDIFDSFWEDPKTLGDGLDGKACYIFLISHPDNRLVCKISTSKIMVLGYSTGNCLYSLINPDVNMDPIEYLKEQACLSSNIEKRECFHVKTLDELKEKTKQLSWEDCTGLLLTYWDDKTPRLRCYKIVPDEYTERRDLRGSEPNFRLRYLQLRDEAQDDDFRNLFPEKKEFFDQIEKDLTIDLPRYLKQLYYERYSRKQFTRLPPEEHYILEKTKGGYVSGKSILDNLRLTLNGCNPRQLNALIKYMYASRKVDAKNEKLREENLDSATDCQNDKV